MLHCLRLSCRTAFLHLLKYSKNLEPLVLWDVRGEPEQRAYLASMLNVPQRPPVGAANTEPTSSNNALTVIAELHATTTARIKQLELQIKQLNDSGGGGGMASTDVPVMPVQAPKELLNRWMISLRCSLLDSVYKQI